jgi:hypothetical protein
MTEAMSADDTLPPIAGVLAAPTTPTGTSPRDPPGRSDAVGAEQPPATRSIDPSTGCGGALPTPTVLVLNCFGPRADSYQVSLPSSSYVRRYGLPPSIGRRDTDRPSVSCDDDRYDICASSGTLMRVRVVFLEDIDRLEATLDAIPRPDACVAIYADNGDATHQRKAALAYHLFGVDCWRWSFCAVSTIGERGAGDHLIAPHFVVAAWNAGDEYRAVFTTLFDRLAAAAADPTPTGDRPTGLSGEADRPAGLSGEADRPRKTAWHEPHGSFPSTLRRMRRVQHREPIVTAMEVRPPPSVVHATPGTCRECDARRVNAERSLACPVAADAPQLTAAGLRYVHDVDHLVDPTMGWLEALLRDGFLSWVGPHGHVRDGVLGSALCPIDKTRLKRMDVALGVINRSAWYWRPSD